MTDKDALAEAKEALTNAEALRDENHRKSDVKIWLQFAQTAALIAIAEALTEKKDD